MIEIFSIICFYVSSLIEFAMLILDCINNSCSPSFKVPLPYTVGTRIPGVLGLKDC